MIDNLNKDIIDADYIIVCLGKEIFDRTVDEQKICIDKITKMVSDKNYFYLSTDSCGKLRQFDINQKRLSCPLYMDNKEEEEKQWDFYNKWMASSLAKKLVIIELGEDFSNPNVVKWPFERITMINQKSVLYRINKMFYQVPPEITERSVTINMDAYEYIMNL